MDGEIAFRGVKGRTFDDQMRAAVEGYSSVAEMAVDELAKMVLDLQRRVDALERGGPVYVQEVDE
jgi:hypothetical protein